MKTVTTQKELDEANGEWVRIKSGDFWILRGNSHAELWDFSAVHKLSEECKIKKGSKATIIIPKYPKNIREWANLKGIIIENNRINLYKVVKLNGTDFHTGTINYLCKADVVDPKWNDDFTGECGKALHLADSPEGAKYFLSDKSNYLLIEVSAATKDCRPFGGSPEYPMKLRARACQYVRIIEKVVNGICVPIE